MFGSFDFGGSTGSAFGGFGDSSGFGSSGFGSSGFGSSNTGFGSSSGGFGFGSTGSGFGDSGFGSFGSTGSSSGFGSFGSTGGGFGSTSPAFGSSSFGGGGSGGGGFGGGGGGFGGFGSDTSAKTSRGKKFEQFPKDGAVYHSITVHPEFENVSFEELRWADTEALKAGGGSSGGGGGFGSSAFGSTSFGSSTGSGFGGGGGFGFDSGSSFGSFGSSSSGFGSSSFSSGFGSSTGSGFGDFGGFGSTSSGFGSGSGSGFGSFGGFGSSSSSGSGSGGFGSGGFDLFGTSSSGGFGSTGGGFGFGSGSSSSSGFGGFGSGGFGSFGSSSTGSGFGGSTGGGFGFDFGGGGGGGFGSTSSSGGFGFGDTSSSFGGFGSSSSTDFGFGSGSSSGFGGFNFGSSSSGSSGSGDLFGFGSSGGGGGGFGGFGGSTGSSFDWGFGNTSSNSGSTGFGGFDFGSGGFGFGSGSQAASDSAKVTSVTDDPYGLKDMPKLDITVPTRAKQAIGLSQTQALSKAATLQTSGGSSFSLSHPSPGLPGGFFPTPRSAARIRPRFGYYGVTPAEIPRIGFTPEVDPELLVSRQNLRKLHSLTMPPEVIIEGPKKVDPAKEAAKEPELKHGDHISRRVDFEEGDRQETEAESNETRMKNRFDQRPNMNHSALADEPSEHTPHDPNFDEPQDDQHQQLFRHPPHQSPLMDEEEQRQNYLDEQNQLDRGAAAAQNDGIIEDQEENHLSTPQSWVPLLQRPGYYCKPSIQEMEQMPKEELEHLQGFEVGHNEYGSVKWLDEVDVTDLNLDEIIILSQGTFEVYPDENAKPNPGTKLNKPAQVSLIGCWPTKKRPITASMFDTYEKALKATDNIRFVSYDRGSGQWTFQIDGF